MRNRPLNILESFLVKTIDKKKAEIYRCDIHGVFIVKKAKHKIECPNCKNSNNVLLGLGF
jgi:hypothetical protein